MSESYNSENISVLKGLDPVKQVPGMYTDITNPNHMVQEVVDNAVDEAIAGHCSVISVDIGSDGYITIEDNGRGIPVDNHEGENKPAVEVIFTTLHAGGKFNKKDADSAYSFSGGLHGVGVTVTNALSLFMEITVRKDGKVYVIGFENGYLVRPLEEIGTCKKKDNGTKVRFFPDPKYFDEPLDIKLLKKSLKVKAILAEELTCVFTKNGVDAIEYNFPEGLSDYIVEIMGEYNDSSISFSGSSYISGNDDSNYENGEGVDCIVAWNPEFSAEGESYVNMIPTKHGGTHVASLKTAFFNIIKKYMQDNALLPVNLEINKDDLWKNATFLISCRLVDTHFQGQTKEKLISRNATGLIDKTIKSRFEEWVYTNNSDEINNLCMITIESAKERKRKSKKIVKQLNPLLGQPLPGKLADCQSSDIENNEVFIVEGDSAGGSAKQGRDLIYQAILPLKGKPANTWDNSLESAEEEEIVDILKAGLCVEPHSKASDGDLTNLRYGKICIMCDADDDGHHIEVLLVGVFLKHFPALIEKGHVLMIQPPLYSISVKAHRKFKKNKKFYIIDEQERVETIQSLIKKGVDEDKMTVQRFKGLGEMNPEQLWETTLNPDTRKIFPIIFSAETSEEDNEMMAILLSKSPKYTKLRKEWIEQKLIVDDEKNIEI